MTLRDRAGEQDLAELADLVAAVYASAGRTGLAFDPHWRAIRRALRRLEQGAALGVDRLLADLATETTGGAR